LDRLWAAEPDALVVVGAGPRTYRYDSSAVGTFAGFGRPLSIALDGGPVGTTDGGAGRLPLSLAIGAWLLRDRPATPARSGWSIAAHAPPADCARLGSAIAGRSARVGLLVMADGSARNGPKAPGYDDPRAPVFDASVTAALSAASPPALLDLDPDLAEQLLAAGRPALQVLAGAAGDVRFRGGVLYDQAPYGVRYTVAVWEPA
jgi:hypothetical protein